MAEVTFEVSGIHCQGCASRIEAGLSRLEGVRRVSTDIAGNRVAVRYGPGVAVDAIADRLSVLGFQVEATR